MPTKDTQPEEAQYTADGTDGKPVGPEHDASFHAPDFYDPKTGKRIETDWDTEQQKADPGVDPAAMEGQTEQPTAAPAKSKS